MDVLRLAALCRVAGAGPVRRNRLRCIDDLDVEAGAERRDVRHGEVVRAGICARRQGLGKLLEAKGSEDGRDIGVVGEIKINALVERESVGVVVKGDVDL